LADNGNYDRRKIAGSGATTVKSDANGSITIASTNTWEAMTGATSSANGTVGYVNAVPPKDGYNTKFLRADGTWAVPNDKDTHNTAYIYAGASNGSANAATATGNTHLILKDGSSVSSRVKLVPGTNMSIISDANGNVTFTSTNTTYTIATGDSNGQIKVTPSSGDAYNVSVKGLGSAAYANTSLFPIVSTYTLPAAKGVRIQYQSHVPVLISAQRSNSEGRLILLGGGYGA